MHTQSSPGSPPHCSGILLCVTTILLIGSCGERASDQRQSVVQIRTSDGRILGSGFFVQLAKTRGEDAHVVVPYEFVSSGIPVVVESFVPAPNSGGGKYYIQEYPETAVVSAIPSANVAVLQVKNVPIEHIEPLVVSGATEVPPQSAVRMLGVLSNRNAKNRKVHDVDAEILNYETFAAWDPFIKRNLPTEIHGFAVDQPFDRGFIGGPILNELGEVIGQVAGEFAQESAGVKTIAVYASGIHRALDEAEVGEKADMPTIEDAQGVIDEALNALLMDVKANTEMIEGTLVRHAELPQLHQGLTELIQNSNVLENICGSGSERTKLQYQLSYLAATPPQVWETLPENGTECGDEQQCLRTIFRPYARSQFEAYLRWDRAEKAEYKVIPPLEDYGENTYRVRVRKTLSQGGAGDAFPVYIEKDYGKWKLSLVDTKNSNPRLAPPPSEREFRGDRWTERDSRVDAPARGIKRTFRESISLSRRQGASGSGSGSAERIEITQRFDVTIESSGSDSRVLCRTSSLHNIEGYIERRTVARLDKEKGVLIREPWLGEVVQPHFGGNCGDCNCAEDSLPWLGVAIARQAGNDLWIANGDYLTGTVETRSYIPVTK